MQQAFSEAEVVLESRKGGLPGVMMALTQKPVIDDADVDAMPFNGPYVGNADLYGYTTSDFKTVVVHPWVQGVGQGNGHYRYLSPRNAVNTLANKLVDSQDDFRPLGLLDYFAISISGSSYENLSSTLRTFLGIYSEPTLYMCARRSAQLARLQAEREKLPIAAINARWDAVTESSSTRWNYYTGVVGATQAIFAGYDVDNSSLEEAVGVVAKKKAGVIEEALNEAKSALNSIDGGAGRIMLMKEKLPQEAAAQLRKSDTGFEYPLSVAVLYCGAVDSLNDFYGLFI